MAVKHLPERVAGGDYREGIRWMILRHPTLGHLSAYVGIPSGSPRAGIDQEKVPVAVHGGWTWGEEGDGVFRPAGWFWWGWDYAHLGDYVPGAPGIGGEHLWTENEVEAQVMIALPLFEDWLGS